MVRRHLAVALTIAWLAGVSACSANDPADDLSPTCGALQSAVDDAQREAELAIADLSTSPEAAALRMADVQESLALAREEVATDERDYLRRADRAADKLVRQIERSAAGSAVNGEAVSEVREELLRVVQDVRSVC